LGEVRSGGEGCRDRKQGKRGQESLEKS